MRLHHRIRAAILAAFTAVVCLAAVSTQPPSSPDWSVGDLFVGIGNLGDDSGQHIVYSPAGTKKEALVDTTAGRDSTTTGCMVAPTSHQDALYTTTFFGLRVMRFAAAHPHAATLAATVRHRDVDSIESLVFDKHGNYYVGGLPAPPAAAGEPSDPFAYIFKYRREGTSDVLQATYQVNSGSRGVDWLDLGPDEETFYFTSEGSAIHEFRPAGSVRGFLDRQIRLDHDGTAYAIRALPPAPGSGSLDPSGFLVASADRVLRVTYDGTTLQSYDDPGKIGHFFALNITPDGQYFWTATYQNPDPEKADAGHLYKFHIPTGTLVAGPIAVTNAAGARVRSVFGLCIKREYTAAVNVCYAMDRDGNAKLDASGNPITEACRIPEVCSSASGDEDGDGLADAEDPDCRDPKASAPPSIAAAPNRRTREGDAVPASSPVAIRDPDGSPLTVDVTGLPAGISFTTAGTGAELELVFNGTVPFGTVALDTVFPVTIVASDGDNKVSAGFDWTILDVNGPISLAAPADRVCVVGEPCDTQFAVTIQEPDREDANVTFATSVTPASLATASFRIVSPLVNSGAVLLSGGQQRYSLLVSATPVATVTFTDEGTVHFIATAADRREVNETGERDTGPAATTTWNLRIVVNRPPDAVGDTASTIGVAPVTIDVLANDTDADSGDSISIVGFTPPPNGSLLQTSASFTYTANLGFSGTDTFTYTIRDTKGATATATVGVNVAPQPPDCAAARPSISQIWTPNHAWVDIHVFGVSNADGSTPAITITGIFQDEPTKTSGDGNTAIDGAGIGTSVARVRAERGGTPKLPGNGRVYEIQFTAANPGASCSGAVFVGVPHDRGTGAAVDDGTRFDSTIGGGPRIR